MKKLLLILICLIMSFEVKSDSNDFSNKKFSCDDSVSINELFSMVGFDFSSKKMTFYQLRTTTGILNASRASTVLGKSKMDFAPDDTVTIGVSDKDTRSCEMSKLFSSIR